MSFHILRSSEGQLWTIFFKLTSLKFAFKATDRVESLRQSPIQILTNWRSPSARKGDCWLRKISPFCAKSRLLGGWSGNLVNFQIRHKLCVRALRSILLAAKSFQTTTTTLFAIHPFIENARERDSYAFSLGHTEFPAQCLHFPTVFYLLWCAVSRKTFHLSLPSSSS